MRRTIIALCIVAQVLVLAWMAGEREHILATGKRIYLRTAPIDPRDPFRGDFVRLSYPMNSVAPARLRGDLEADGRSKGDRVYAVLAPGARELYDLDYLTDREPGDGVFVRGRVRYDWRPGRGRNVLAVKYGIEQLFVEQGAGIGIEQRRGTRRGLQVPMEVQVAVSAGGTAVIRDFRWSRLGIQLEMLRTPTRNANQDPEEAEGPLSPKLRVRLRNVSDAPLAIADPGDRCGFEMRELDWVTRDYAPAWAGCDGISAGAADRIVLAPEEEYTVELDLGEPRWHVSVDGRTGEIGRFAGTDAFRIVYRAPEGRDDYWEGELPSSAFTTFRLLD